MNKAILLIGKPHSSKTVFLSQFYSRLQKKKSRLTLYKPVDDLSPITAAREALANGDEPQTTPPEKSVKFNLPIQFGEEQVDLLCPEYGGEQVNKVIETREVNKDWGNAITESNHWIIFIRLNSINKALDLTDVTVVDNPIIATAEDSKLPFSLSEQVSFIELLQILLHLKGHDYHVLNQKVKLTIALTCWDELSSNCLPADLLKEKMPLFKNFVDANWAGFKINVVGLSAQGFSLKDKINKEKYQIEGPENFGYLVFPNGEQTKDITELIAQALQ